MSQNTIFLARLIGLFIIIVDAGVSIRGSEAIGAAMADGTVVFVLALAGVALGLAMVLTHNVWTGGLLPLVVTLVGWAALAKGAALLFLPTETFTALMEAVAFDERFILYLAPSLLIGIYLTYVGFAASRKE